MHITVSPTGEISIETNGSTPGEIAATILSIQREMRQQSEATVRERPVSLNDCQGETYDWLVAHDTQAGIHISALATAFGINKDAASNRLQRLVEMGFARRVGAGKYRAVTE